jgi:hypothetical protein
MTLLTPGELNMYRRRFLCALYKLANGLVDKPVDADKVFKEMGIGSFNGAEQEATDNLVENAILNEYVKRENGREIMLTTDGVQWCTRECNL